MPSWLKRLVVWLGDNVLGHAIFETGKAAFTKSAEDVYGKVGAAVVNRLTRKDLILGIVFARLATDTSSNNIAEGVKKFNEFYAKTRGREARDRVEKLIYRDVLDAIQEHFKESQIKDEHRDPKTGKVLKVTLTPTNNQQATFQKYLALLGEAGPKEIRLELDRLEQLSGVKQVTAAIGKGASKTVTGLASFINGLNGIEEKS